MATKIFVGKIGLARDVSTGKLVAFREDRRPAAGKLSQITGASAKGESVKNSASRFVSKHRDMLLDLAKK